MGVKFLGVFIFCLVIFGAVFSSHGLLDLIKFRKQIESTHARVGAVEEENRALRSRLDLLEQASPDVLETQLRTVLGWVKPDEIVYFESKK